MSAARRIAVLSFLLPLCWASAAARIDSSTDITTLRHGTRVKVLGDARLNGVQVQIQDKRIGCLDEKDQVQLDQPEH